MNNFLYSCYQRLIIVIAVQLVIHLVVVAIAEGIIEALYVASEDRQLPLVGRSTRIIVLFQEEGEGEATSLDQTIFTVAVGDICLTRDITEDVIRLDRGSNSISAGSLSVIERVRTGGQTLDLLFGFVLV